jgi:ribose-phosphate pyrophosphokinase
VHLPDGCDSEGRQPVLIDDIVSTGGTLAAAAQCLRAAGWGEPLAVGVHALLQREDLEALHRAGVLRLVSCDTVAHATNAISVLPQLAEAVRQLLR